MVAPRNETALRMRIETSGLTARATGALADGEVASRATTGPPRVAENGTAKWPAASVVAVATSAPATAITTARPGVGGETSPAAGHRRVPDGGRVVERERERLARRLGGRGQDKQEQGENDQPSHGEHPFRSRLADSC